MKRERRRHRNDISIRAEVYDALKLRLEGGGVTVSAKVEQLITEHLERAAATPEPKS